MLYRSQPFFMGVGFLSACFGIALLFSQAATAQNLRITLANTPPRSGEISTRIDDSLSLTVLSGERVSFARASGRDYRLQAGGGFFWTQVQELPRNGDAVAITPVMIEGGMVEVALDVSRKVGTREQRFTTTLVAQPGEWLQLFGPAPQHSRDTRVYGTQTLSEDSLYILVDVP